MQFIHRRIGAVILGLAAATVLPVLTAGQTQAATTTVEIEPTAKPNAGGTKEVALAWSRPRSGPTPSRSTRQASIPI